MYLSLCVAIILLLIQSSSGSHVEDNQVIIGSSIAGVLSLIIFILDIIAIFELLKADRGMCWKLIWILIIIFFPIGGLFLYCCCARTSTVNEIV